MSYEAADFLTGLFGGKPPANLGTGPDAAGEPNPAPRQPQEHAPMHGGDPRDLGPDGAPGGPAVDAPGDGSASTSPAATDAPDGPAVDVAGDPSGGLDFSDWVRRPDCNGRMGREAPNLPEADRWWSVGDFESLPEPGDPCPRCGSLETWWDLLGAEHCGHCEADKLKRALGLADRAARLRRRNPPRQNQAPGVAPVARKAAGPTGNTSEASGDSGAVCGASQGCGIG